LCYSVIEGKVMGRLKRLLENENKLIGSGQSQQAASTASTVNQSQLKADTQQALSAGKRKTSAKRGKTGNCC